MTASNERAQVYRFGVFEVDVPAHELRKQGVRVRLQDRPFQVLLLLLERAGQVVTRDDLRQRIWPSTAFVDFDHGMNNAIARLRDVLGDQVTSPRFIETIPRVGYRFLEAVTPRPDEEPAAVAASAPAPRGWRRNLWLVVAVGVAGAALLAALLYLALADRQDNLNRVASGVEPGPSIAVLPFVSLGSGEEDEHFADGLTEELVTKLASIHGLRVVARTSSYRFKGKQESAAAIAQSLQVNHLLEGSVRRAGIRLRITAQLIDARKDGHIWSQTFERDAGDIFQIQEDIAFAVAAALKVSLLGADETRVRRRGTSDPEAYRLYLLAQGPLRGRTRASDPSVAKRLLDASVARDPNFAEAHAGLARYYFGRAWTGLIDTEDSPRLGAAAAERAVALDPASSDALVVRADFAFWRYRFRGDYAAQVAAESDMRRAIDLDPSNSMAFEDFGRAILWQQPDAAASLLEQAIQVDRLCVGPNIMIAVLLGSRGQLEAARARCADLLKRYPDSNACGMAIGTLETYFGHFERAVPLLRASETLVGGAARIQLWSVYMSMGDPVGALRYVDFGNRPMEKALSDAAHLAMVGRYEQAFTVLDRRRGEFPVSHLLDLPTAKFALIAGKPRQALGILEQRLPDIVSGVEPISARNVMPAIDLATAQLNTGARERARRLLKRVAAYLDGPGALRLPLFAFQRARVHALSGEPDAALRALDEAYNQGLRTTWALDLRPQSFLYIDPIAADPAFATLRDDPRLIRWFQQIRADNARQRERLGTPRP